MPVRRPLPAAAALALALVPPAGAGEAGSGPGVLGLVIENDIFAGFDDQYTNGTYLRYTPGPDRLPALGRFLRRQAEGVVAAEGWRMTYGLGQAMFTPDDITLRDPPRDDRPYAGFLFGTVAISADAGDRLDTLAVDLGVVGPPSFAEQTQKAIHQVIGDDPKGWGTQLGTELAFRVLYERIDRVGATLPASLGGLEVEALPQLALAAGTLDVSVTGALTLRIGEGLGIDYGPQRVRRSIAGPAELPADGELAWYLFASAEGRVVGRDLFLGGNTFRSSRSVEPERLVGDVAVGGALRFGSVYLSYSHVFRSPDFTTRDGWSEFGSLSLQIPF